MFVESPLPKREGIGAVRKKFSQELSEEKLRAYGLSGSKYLGAELKRIWERRG